MAFERPVEPEGFPFALGRLRLRATWKSSEVEPTAQMKKSLTLAGGIGKQMALDRLPDAVRDMHPQRLGDVAAKVWRLVQVLVRGSLEGGKRQAEPFPNRVVATPFALATRGPERKHARPRVALECSAQIEARGKHRFDQPPLDRVSHVESETQHDSETVRPRPSFLLVRAPEAFLGIERLHVRIMGEGSDMSSRRLRIPCSFIDLRRVARALRVRRACGRPWALSLIDRLRLVCWALRTNLTIREIGMLFGVSKSQVHRVISALTRRLSALFDSPNVDRRSSWVVDGTLVPTRDHRAAAKSKNYRWSCNLQVLIRRRDLRVLALDGAGPGNRNDPIHYRGTRIERLCKQHGKVLADGGYRGVPELVTPIFRKNRIRRDAAWRRHRRRRARVEHALARLKEWRILRDYRRKGCSLLASARAVALLENSRAELRDSS